MAFVYQDATLEPGKLELLAAWLPSQPWFPGGSVERVAGAYRFDDPAGEVGLEGQLVRLEDGRVVHAPLSYRAAPLAGAEEFLVGTTEHSALGTRWVYDAVGDPVWAAALATAILTGGTQAELYFEVDGVQQRRESRTKVRGSGMRGTRVPDAADLDLVVVRVLGFADEPFAETLTATWPGGGPAVVAGIRG